MMTGLYNTLIASAPPAAAGGTERERPVARIAPASGGGNAEPPGGKNLPEKPVEAAITRADVERAIERLAQFAADHQRGLRFAVDEGSGRTIITVVNAATNEVVRQIPSDEVIAIARALRVQRAGLLNEQA